MYDRLYQTPLTSRQKCTRSSCRSQMIRRSGLRAKQLHVLQSGFFRTQTVVGAIFSDQLTICVSDCILRVQGFLRNKEEQKLNDNC